jgi:hypothetical protein
MIVWGGLTGGGTTNTGKRYNPATDSWTNMTTTGVPGARLLHTAVWTGTEMIVWGGYPVTDTGGRYCDVGCSMPAFGGIQSVNGDGPCKTGIDIAWQSASNFINGTYSVMRYTGASCAGPAITIADNLPANVTQYTDMTASSGVTYYYQVIATNNCQPPASTAGIVSCSAGVVDEIPAPPSGLTNNTAADISSCGDTGVGISWAPDPLNWGDNGYGNRSYQILRDGIAICTTPPDNCGVDTIGNNGQMYTYAVRYINGCGLSADTTGATAMDWVDITPCPGIGNTLHVSKSGTDIIFNWTADTCTDLANYRVYGSTIYFAPFPAAWMPLGSPTATTFSLSQSSSYIAYRVVSVDGCCNDSP